MKIYLIIFFIFVVTHLSSVVYAKKAYWGLVSTGSGSGALGHGFLLFKQDNEPFFTGDVYQYNITVQNDPRNLGVTTIDLRHIDFSLKIQKFYTIFHYYTFTDNRSIGLYELNLSSDEIDHLLKLLNTDLNNPHFREQFPYGPDNNCVGRPIELINQVVDSRKRIEYLGRKGGVLSISRGIQKAISDPLLNRIPFYIAETLEHHPISKGLVKYYDRKATYQARFYAASLREIHLLVQTCYWSPTVEKSLQFYYGMFLNSGGKNSLQPVIDLASNCKKSEKPLLKSFLDLYEALEPASLQAKEEVYKLVNTVLESESKQ